MLWFRIKGAAFIAWAKIGPKAASGDLEAIAAIVRSFRSARCDETRAPNSGP
jgi:hypothetical protein